MPKIEVYRDTLMERMGTSMSDPELEELLTVAKAELDESADDDGIMKIELNDTNRPDLWSTSGLARQLRLYRSGNRPEYSFFSTAGNKKDAGDRRVVVDESVQSVRPYVVGFVMSGRPIDEPTLKDLIQTQEKLTWNFGRKRKSIAMGIYRSDLIAYPVRYKAVNPDATRFVPLGLETELSMREMLTEHPKGRDFGGIVADSDVFPLLTDDNGDVLSFPPVINSARIGAVEVGDTRLFIELTGTDMDSLLLTASIVACDVTDAGYTVEPVIVEYPYETPYGRFLTVPYYYQEPQTAELDQINQMLGVRLTVEEAVASLKRMGIDARSERSTITAIVPPYRNDFLHAVDVVEDVMIGRGMDRFEPQMPHEFTVGRLAPVEEFSRTVKELMVGLGFTEMIFNYLGSARDFLDRNYQEDDRESAYREAVRIANPMSENYEFVRPSIIPSLLSSESISANAMYPHHIFEVGKVVRRDPRDVTGTVTHTTLGWLSAGKDVGFNLASSHVSAILYYVGREYSLQESQDPRFIPGRAADVMFDGMEDPVGVFGEIHPWVLENWGIQTPCTAGEFVLERIMDGGDGSKTG